MSWRVIPQEDYDAWLAGLFRNHVLRKAAIDTTLCNLTLSAGRFSEDLKYLATNPLEISDENEKETLQKVNRSLDQVDALRTTLLLVLSQLPSFKRPPRLSKPKTLRDKMFTVLSTFADLERQLGIVQDSTLYLALSKFDIPKEESIELVNQLLKEEIISSPRKGYLRRSQS
jgi:hypothetical protein